MLLPNWRLRTKYFLSKAIYTHLISIPSHIDDSEFYYYSFHSFIRKSEPIQLVMKTVRHVFPMMEGIFNPFEFCEFNYKYLLQSPARWWKWRFPKISATYALTYLRNRKTMPGVIFRACLKCLKFFSSNNNVIWFSLKKILPSNFP